MTSPDACRTVVRAGAPVQVTGVLPNPRDAGLVRVLGVWTLAAGAISMIVGAGIFAVPAALYASIGPYGPLALLVCGIAVGSVGICFAEGCSRLPTSGGVYGLIEASFGAPVAFVAGTLLWVSCVLACGSVAAALADLVAGSLPAALHAPARSATIVAALGGIALVNIGGAARGARLVGATTALKLLPLLVFVLAGLLAAGRAAPPPLPATHPQLAGVGRALILGVFAFIGMETPLCASGEVREPNRTIPRALAIAMLATLALYVAVQYVAQSLLGAALGNSTAPLADAMGQIHPALRALMLAGAALSMLGYLGSDILGSPRQLFALARDGLMPASLGRIRPDAHAPHVAIAFYTLLAALLALSGSFADLAVLATLAMAPLYLAGCAAAWVLARRGVARAGTPLNFRFLGVAAVTGTAGMLLLVGLASGREIFGLLALLATSTLWYYIQVRSMRRRPQGEVP